jgi:hypothetical protein
MAFLPADKAGVLLILHPLWLIHFLALIRTVCKAMSRLLAAMTEEHSWWLVPRPEGL